MLNDNQKAAVEFKDGACLVLAGPGSGKTTVITRRILSLIEKGVKPETILVITFTRAAAKEMQDRFLKLDPKGGAVNFGTFHSVFYHILAKECNYKAEDILKDSTKKKILKDVLRKQNIRLNDDESLESIFAGISRIKGAGISIEELKEKEYREFRTPEVSFTEYKRIYFEYHKALDINHKIDFDDMVEKCYELFLKYPNRLCEYQDRFKYIMVDEAQDMAMLQYKVVKMLALPDNNLFIVGDDDQSIYGFRGSDPKIMMSFLEDFDGASLIELSQNYRSAKTIVEKAKRLIENNKTRFNKKTIAVNSYTGCEISVLQYNSEIDEAKNIAKRIKEENKKGTEYKKIAVLYRNHSHVQTLESVLVSENIPTNAKIHKEKYEDEIVKDILCYIKIAKKEGKRIDFLRVMNKPDRGIFRQALDDENVSLDSIIDYYYDDDVILALLNKWKMLNEYLIKMPASGAISLIGYSLGYENYLKRMDFKAFSFFEKLKEEANYYRNANEFCRYLTNFLEDSRDKPKETISDGVGLYTLHASKGLEFDIVFIIQASEGFIPQKQCVSNEAIEEERRLFYVGMTRAKNSLYVSTTKTFKNRPMMPSRFLEEIE